MAKRNDRQNRSVARSPPTSVCLEVVSKARGDGSGVKHDEESRTSEPRNTERGSGNATRQKTA